MTRPILLVTNGALVLGCCCCCWPGACDTVDVWMNPWLPSVVPMSRAWLEGQPAFGPPAEATRECARVRHQDDAGDELAWIGWYVEGQAGHADVLVSYRKVDEDWTVLGAFATIDGAAVVLGDPRAEPAGR